MWLPIAAAVCDSLLAFVSIDRMAALFTSMPRLGAFSGSRVAAPQRVAVQAPVLRRGAVQVFAADDQKKKRTPQPVKRAELSEDRRARNRSRKSAIATRMKKVINWIDDCAHWRKTYSGAVCVYLHGARARNSLLNGRLSCSSKGSSSNSSQLFICISSMKGCRMESVCVHRIAKFVVCQS